MAWSSANSFRAISKSSLISLMHKDQTAGVPGFVRGGFRQSAQCCRKIGVYLSNGVFPCFVQIPVLYISGDEVGPSSSFLCDIHHSSIRVRNLSRAGPCSLFIVDLLYLFVLTKITALIVWHFNSSCSMSRKQAVGLGYSDLDCNLWKEFLLVSV